MTVGESLHRVMVVRTSPTIAAALKNGLLPKARVLADSGATGAQLREYTKIGCVSRPHRFGKLGRTGTVALWPPEAVQQVCDVRRLLASGITLAEQARRAASSRRPTTDRWFHSGMPTVAVTLSELRLKLRDSGVAMTERAVLELIRGLEARGFLQGRVEQDGLAVRVVFPNGEAADSLVRCVSELATGSPDSISEAVIAGWLPWERIAADERLLAERAFDLQVASEVERPGITADIERLKKAVALLREDLELLLDNARRGCRTGEIAPRRAARRK